MTLRMTLAAALCLALVACLAAMPVGMGALAAARVERNKSLWVDLSKMTIAVGQTQPVKLTWTSKKGQLFYEWDDASVINFKKSGVWDGDTTTLYVTGLAPGKTTITITNSVDDDRATIVVTVVDEGRQQDVSELLGLSVKSANLRLDDRLKAVSGGYSNGYFHVALNEFKRVRDITVYASAKRYTLFSIYPGMNFNSAAAQLKRLGWKQVKKRGGSVYYLNEDHLCRAVCLEKKSGKVVSVRYYVP